MLFCPPANLPLSGSVSPAQANRENKEKSKFQSLLLSALYRLILISVTFQRKTEKAKKNIHVLKEQGRLWTMFEA